MTRLIITRDGRVQQEAELDDRVLRIGRDRGNDLVLEDPGKGVSRVHAEIRPEGGRYTIVDRESRNGTWVNGQRVTEAPLAPDSVVAIGPYQIRLVSDLEEEAAVGSGTADVAIAPEPEPDASAERLLPPFEGLHAPQIDPAPFARPLADEAPFPPSPDFRPPAPVGEIPPNQTDQPLVAPVIEAPIESPPVEPVRVTPPPAPEGPVARSPLTPPPSVPPRLTRPPAPPPPLPVLRATKPPVVPRRTPPPARTGALPEWVFPTVGIVLVASLGAGGFYVYKRIHRRPPPPVLPMTYNPPPPSPPPMAPPPPDPRQVTQQQIDEHLTSARQAFDSGDWQTAIDEANKVLALDATDPDATALLKQAQDKQKADADRGTLIVLTGGVDGVIVQIDGKDQHGRSKKGQLTLPVSIGQHKVAVSKDGFLTPEPQNVEIVKGDKKTVQFSIVEEPKVARLQLPDAPRGVRVFVDNGTTAFGVTDPDRLLELKPGEHSFRFELDGFHSKTITRTFGSGERKTLAWDEVGLQALTAPSTPVQNTTPKGPASPMGLEHFRTPWTGSGGGWYKCQGAAPNLYDVPNQSGEFAFNFQPQHKTFGSQHIRWRVAFRNMASHLLMEMDEKNLVLKAIVPGHEVGIGKVLHNVRWKSPSVSLAINIAPTKLSHQVLIDGQWHEVDNLSISDPRLAAASIKSFTEGRFGLDCANDLEISGFEFRPR